MEKDKHEKRINVKDLGKKNIHSVPDGYFDKLPYSIQEKINAVQKNRFEFLILSPAKYALPGLAVVFLAIIIYLITPKAQKQVAENKTAEIKKDTSVHSPEKSTAFVEAVPLNSNTKMTEQKKIRTDTVNNTKHIPTAKESPEIYLAEISREDMQEYLDLNDPDQLQPEDVITD